MSHSRLPVEIELVYELMPCNAQRTAQEPIRVPHPCSYFRKWGTYHSYGYETTGPPPRPGIVEPTQYLGRAPLVPEMLSGCRKAPIMTVGINPNLPGWWSASRNAINPLFDDYQQYAHYFRYRTTAKLDIRRKDYVKYGGGPQDTPFGDLELNVPKDAKGLRTIHVELAKLAMYEGYQSLLEDLATEMNWSKHRLSVGEDLSYGNMVACPSAKWITKLNPTDPAMPPMSRGEQAGIVAECFHHRRYFLRQLFQSLPAVLMIFSQATTDAFLGEMKGHFSEGKPEVGEHIEDLLKRTVRLRYGKTKDGQVLDARVIFSPHITGDPASFGRARSQVLAQLIQEARSGGVTFNALTGHLARPRGGCVFCTMLEIGPCDYAAELKPLSEAPGVSADSSIPHLVTEKQAQTSLLDEFLTTGARSNRGWALAGDPARERRPGPRPGKGR